MIRILQIEWPQQWPSSWSVAWPTGWSIAWIMPWSGEQAPIEQIDFGEGHMVSAADLLDGHFQRLAAQPVLSTPTPVVTESHLHTTIAVVAPTLTPLTDLAEEMAQTVPLAQPTPHFRDTLYKALEQSHRQHQAQRILGVQPTPVEAPGHSTWLLVGVAFTIVGICLAIYSRHYFTISRN